MLNNHYPQNISVVNDWHAEKGAKAFFSGFLNIVEAGMSGGILEIDWFRVFGHKPHEPLANFQAHMADGFFVQPSRCHQHMGVHVLIEQINGADLSSHHFAYTNHDNVQR